MKRFQTIIQKYITNHQKHKKYLAGVLALSVLVSFGVSAGLIMPAISMTDEDTNQSVSYEAVPLANESGGIQYQYLERAYSVSEVSGNGIDFGDKITNVSVGAPTNITEDDEADIKVYLDYKFTSEDDVKNKITKENPYIYYHITDSDIKIPQGGFFGEACKVFDGSTLAGYYSISESGDIVIKFINDYIDKKIATTGTLTGTLNFKGSVKRDKTESGDKHITIGGKDATVDFEDRPVNLNKDSQVRVENSKNYIDWSITMTTPRGYTAVQNGDTLTDILTDLTDNKTVNISNVSVKYDDGSDVACTVNNGVITFNENIPPETTITITYTTEDAQQGHEYNNTADLDLKTSDKKPHTEKKVNVDKQTQNISKSAKADYDVKGNGVPNGEIIYNIEVEDSYGQSLKDFNIYDIAFLDSNGIDAIMEEKTNEWGGKYEEWTYGENNPYKYRSVSSNKGLPVLEKDDIIVKDSYGNNVNFTLNNGYITVNDDVGKVFIEYRLPEDIVWSISNEYGHDVGNGNVNYAAIKPKDNPDTPKNENSGKIEYNKTPYSISKSGTPNYDSEAFRWNITVTATGLADGLKGATITDDLFVGIDPEKITIVGDRYGTKLYITDFTVENGVLTINQATESGVDYVITYDVPLTDEQKSKAENGETVTQSNSATINKDKFGEKGTGEQSCDYSNRENMNKVLEEIENKSVEEIIDPENAKKEFKWHIDITTDKGFYNDTGDKVLVDIMSVEEYDENGVQIESTQATHTMTDAQFNNIFIQVKENADNGYWGDGDTKTLVKDTDYTIEKTDTGFQIAFNQSVENKYKFAHIVYSTIADYRAIAGENGYGHTVEFANDSSFGKLVSPKVEYKVKSKDPKNVSYNVSVKKKWNDNDNSAGKRQEVTVSLMRRPKDSEDEWEEVSSTTVPLPYGNNQESEKVTFPNGPFPDSVQNEDGTLTEYEYIVVEETKIDGYKENPSVTVDVKDKNNGTMDFTVTNELEDSLEKFAIDQDGNKITNITAEDLEKLVPTYEKDGKKYYVFRWEVSFNAGMVLTEEVPNDYIFFAPDGVNSGKSNILYDSKYLPETYDGSAYWTMNSYEIAVTNNIVQFKPNANIIGVRYYIAVPADAIDNEIYSDAEHKTVNENYSFSVDNTVKSGDTEDTAKIKITNSKGGPQKADVISKGINADADTWDGENFELNYLEYYLDINPEALKLTDGKSGINVVDTLKTKEYIYNFGKDDAESATGQNLVDAILQELKVIDVATGRELLESEYNIRDISDTVTDVDLSDITKDSSNNATMDVMSGDIVTLELGNVTESDLMNFHIYIKDESNKNINENGDSGLLVTNYLRWEDGKAFITVTVPNGASKLELNAWGSNLQYTISATAKRTPSASEIHLTLPDEMHLRVEYKYIILTNENSPSLGKTNEKTHKKIVAGDAPSPNDKITFSNSASLKTVNITDEATKDNVEIKVSDSLATVTPDTPPSIKKVDVNDYSLQLNANFKFAKYVDGKWQFAKALDTNTDNNSDRTTVSDWTDGVTGNSIPTDACDVEFTGSPFNIVLDSNVLYKMVEVTLPEGYEGTNITIPPGETFESVLKKYLQGQLTNDNNVKNFLDNYVHTYYIVSGKVDSYPEGVNSSDVIQAVKGSTVNITNNKLIDVKSTKKWPKDVSGEVEVELLWSTKKTIDGSIPSDAKPVEKTDESNTLNLFGDNVSAKQTLTDENQYAYTWRNLPSGKNGVPIYYYVRENKYKIGNDTYELDRESGEYKNGSTVGQYSPVYQGNGNNNPTDNNKTVEISITNSKGLELEKRWLDSNDNALSNIPAEAVKLRLYGTLENGESEQIESKEEDKLFTLTANDNWKLSVPDSILGNKKYTTFTAEEVSVKLKGKSEFEELDSLGKTYTISPFKELTGTTGVVGVINKDSTPSNVSVSVEKKWADGNDSHNSDTVTVKLFRSTSSDVTIDELQTINNNGTVQGKIITEESSVQLSNANSWKHTWSDLTYSENGENYYYYVLETSGKNGYTASYEKNGNDYVITNSPPTVDIQVEKTWADGNSGRPDSIDLKLQRKESNGTWTDVTGVTPTLEKNDDKWIYTYKNLPEYQYKIVEENVPTGYTVQYVKDGEADNSGVIRLTNTKLLSLTLKKIWSDNDEHTGDKISIKVHRSTNDSDAKNNNLPLVMSISGQKSMQANSTQLLSVNRTGNIKWSSSDSSVVAISAQGDTIYAMKRASADETSSATIVARKAGAATITAQCGSEIATIEITVTIASTSSETTTTSTTTKATTTTTTKSEVVSTTTSSEESKEEPETSSTTTTTAGGVNNNSFTLNGKDDSKTITLDSSKKIQNINVSCEIPNDYVQLIVGGTLNGNYVFGEYKQVESNVVVSAGDWSNWFADTLKLSLNTDGAVATINSVTITYSDGTTQTYGNVATQNFSLKPISLGMIGLKHSAAETSVIAGQLSDFDSNGVANLIMDCDSDTLNGQKWIETYELPAYDENGHEYYYWVEEVKVGGYTTSYQFSDSNGNTNCIQGDGTITIINTKEESPSVTMPSTGGTGTTWYYITGMALMLIPIVILARRRKKLT
ncbi:MAG: Cna B-type domain-containing protein [Ruminococcus sp.]|nr:Cna B-type domain-containing protein [Ruminococcus sp.]